MPWNFYEMPTRFWTIGCETYKIRRKNCSLQFFNAQNPWKWFILPKFVFEIKQTTNTMIQSMLIGGLGTPELVIIAIVVLLLFGGKKIPELMKGVGKGVRSFKKGLNEDDPEDTKKVNGNNADGE